MLEKELILLITRCCSKIIDNCRKMVQNSLSIAHKIAIQFLHVYAPDFEIIVDDFFKNIFNKNCSKNIKHVNEEKINTENVLERNFYILRNQPDAVSWLRVIDGKKVKNFIKEKIKNNKKFDNTKRTKNYWQL